MKLLLTSLTALVMTATSQASIPLTGNELFGKPTNIVAQQKTATQNVQVRAKRIVKNKLFRSNPHRLTHYALIDDQDDIVIADDDLATGYRRRDLVKVEQHEDAPLPENIRWKLFLARQAALLAYRNKYNIQT